MSKAKGSSGGFNGLMLQHGEKGVFAVVILLLLGSVYAAISHESVEATPDQISQAAKSGKQAVERADQNYEPPAAQEIIREVQKADVRVDFIPYELQRMPVPGQSTLDMKKRGAPKIFPIRDLRTSSGNGAILVWREEEEVDTNLTTGTVAVAAEGQQGNRGGMSGPGMMGGMSGPGMSGGMSGPGMMSGMSGPGMMSGMSGPGMGGYGGANSMAEPKIVDWICVTGLIDYQKQVDEYAKCFEDAVQRYPERDMYPAYSSLTIERAEIDKNNPTAQPQWQEINLVAAYEPPFVEWAGFSMEAADSTMATLGLPFVYPLPQLSGGRWNDDVAHEPEIPIMDFTNRQYMMGGFGLQQKKTAKKTKSGKTDEEMEAVYDPQSIYQQLMANNDLLRRSGSRMGGMSGMGGYGGMSGSGMMGMSGGGMGGSSMGSSDPLLSGIRNMTNMGRKSGMSGAGRYGGMSGMSGPGMMGGPMGMSGGYGGASSMYAQPAEYQLFRFLDFGIERGKNYVYRVRIELENPNYQIPVDYLENENSGKDQYLVSDWSDGTSGTKVVGDSQIIVGMADPETKSELKQNPTLVLVKMDAETGQPQLHRLQPKLGQYLNLADATVTESQRQMRSGIGSYGSMMSSGMSGGPRSQSKTKNKKKAEPPKTTDFTTERLVVGLMTGPKLSVDKGEYYGASQVLLMEPDGHLIRLNENQDEAEYLRYFPKGRALIPEAEKSKQGQQGRGGPGMGGPGMGGPGMGSPAMGGMSGY